MTADSGNRKSLKEPSDPLGDLQALPSNINDSLFKVFIPDGSFDLVSQALRRQKNIEDRVVYLLETFPQSRNNDGLLISLYFGLMFGINCFLSLTPNQIRMISSFDSIRRARQKLVAEDRSRFEPTNSETRKRREVKRRAMEKYATNE
jgi:hypothetical protein